MTALEINVRRGIGCAFSFASMGFLILAVWHCFTPEPATNALLWSFALEALARINFLEANLAEGVTE